MNAIKTDTPNSQTIFDLATGLQYELTWQNYSPENYMRIGAVELFITSVSTPRGEYETGFLKYYDEEALSFWRQLADSIFGFHTSMLDAISKASSALKNWQEAREQEAHEKEKVLASVNDDIPW